MKKHAQTKLAIKLSSLLTLIIITIFIYGCRKEKHPQTIVNQNDVGLEIKTDSIVKNLIV